ncbi:MAG TPA: hypothetical protein VMV50_02810 [Candidatus Paceibacterota bacterium]|nr:hypothetical protein [Candidatus Paceibacterota bacterium]
MSWAARRRFIILVIVAIIVAVVAVTAYLLLRPAPSCKDGIQNEGEGGIDCGGPCPYLCTASEEPPTVLFTKAFSNGRGGTNVIASVENKNLDAAANAVPYRITLYGVDHSIVQVLTGTLDLPPGATEPVYVPNVATAQPVASAFLDIASSSPQWYRLLTDPRIVPTVSAITLGGTTLAPRIEATLTNPGVTPLANVRAVVLVHGSDGNVFTASQTVIQSIAGQGQATATFTWESAFPNGALTIEVVPLIPLPPPPLP